MRQCIWIFPFPVPGLLYYEKEKRLHYCEQQIYQVVTLLEGVGCDYSIEKRKLAEAGSACTKKA